ncbi:hypothetical protein FE394_16850 [Xenorhabdus sp. Reich]|uniref:Uncharacterized protein n=1 Tax=Xenorhabdus littoralis TaxID=2582835 RepID=A0ABU4SQ66_9GAMM|nr:hypothetical protein [Xenorhabdus sp. Reich]MDX8000809.1 hypothetical protein [Xenorhabdus sp. Reich]
MRRTRFNAVFEKRNHLKNCEETGIIADSIDVRIAIMSRVKSGEITLEQAQTELKKIKRNAKKNGMKTRAQAWREG